MRLYVLAKDETGLRALTAHLPDDLADAVHDREQLIERGWETTIIVAESLDDLRRSHPAWLEEVA